MIGFLSCIVLNVPFAIIGILFAIFKEVHFDNQKAFEKYLLK